MQAIGSFFISYQRAFKRLFFTIIIVGFFLITALSLVGGSSEPLKQGMEQYFSEVANLRARIGTLEKVTFYPNIALHVKDVVFHPLQGPLEDNPENAPITLKELQISMPFWRYLLGMRYIETLSVTDLVTKHSNLLPAPLSIDFVKIQDKQETDKKPAQAQVSMKGQYNGKPLHVSLGLDKKDIRNNRKLYRKSKDSVLLADIGDIKFSTNINQPHGSKTVLNNTVLSAGDQKVSGRIKISGASKVKLSSDLSFGSSSVKIRGTYKDSLWKGRSDFLSGNIEDFSAFYGFVQTLQDTLFPAEHEVEDTISLASFDMEWHANIILESKE